MRLKLLGFNQDATCFSVISPNKGVTIYNCDPFGKCFDLEKSSINEGEMDFLVEMLFSTSLIAVVDRTIGASKRKKLKIVNSKRKATICELTFPHEIVNVVMNRKIICVVLNSDQIFVYDISCMKLQRTIDVRAEKLLNNGSKAKNATVEGAFKVKISLSTENRSILCYTSYSEKNKEIPIMNDVVVFDALNCIPLMKLIGAHQSNIACIACSSDGRLVATASEKGTIIRVFHTTLDDSESSSGQKAENMLLCEFRRGSRPARIDEMKFSEDKKLLACVGESDTIHIFDVSLAGDNIITKATVVDDLTNSDNLHQSSSSLSTGLTGFQHMSKGLANRFGKIVTSKLSSQNQQRHIAYIKVAEHVRYRIGFPKDVPNTISVCGEDGNYLVYSIPTTEVGPCTLIKSNTFD